MLLLSNKTHLLEFLSELSFELQTHVSTNKKKLSWEKRNTHQQGLHDAKRKIFVHFLHFDFYCNFLLCSVCGMDELITYSQER